MRVVGRWCVGSCWWCTGGCWWCWVRVAGWWCCCWCSACERKGGGGGGGEMPMPPPVMCDNNENVVTGAAGCRDLRCAHDGPARARPRRRACDRGAVACGLTVHIQAPCSHCTVSRSMRTQGTLNRVPVYMITRMPKRMSIRMSIHSELVDSGALATPWHEHSVCNKASCVQSVTGVLGEQSGV